MFVDTHAAGWLFAAHCVHQPDRGFAPPYIHQGEHVTVNGAEANALWKFRPLESRDDLVSDPVIRHHGVAEAHD
jgi:hypothetical protein